MRIIYQYIHISSGPTTKEQRTWPPEDFVGDDHSGPTAPLSNTDILRITKTWSEATNFNYDSVVSLPAHAT